jgi:hypothetical protein
LFFLFNHPHQKRKRKRKKNQGASWLPMKPWHLEREVYAVLVMGACQIHGPSGFQTFFLWQFVEFGLVPAGFWRAPWCLER